MSSNKNLEFQQSVYPSYINAYSVDDEISLVDLWIALLKLKKVFIVSFVLLLAMGLIVVTLFKTDKYNMTSTISIGQVKIDGVVSKLQPPEAVLSKINISILPSSTRYTAENKNISIFKTNIKNPKNTNLIVIENRVNDGNQDVFTKFQQSIVDTVLAEHLELSRVLNSKLQQEIGVEKIALQKLKDPRELVKLLDFETSALEDEKIELFKLTDKDYLESKNRDFQNRIQLFEDNIRLLSEKNQSLKAQADDLKNRATSQIEKSLILDNISDNELSMNEVKQKKQELEREYTDFKFETSLLATRGQIMIESLESDIELIESNWKADIKEQESRIVELKNQLKGGNSRAISIADLSLEPVGLTKNLAYLIAIFLAIVAAFFVTLLAMFRAKVNERLAEEG